MGQRKVGGGRWKLKIIQKLSLRKVGFFFKNKGMDMKLLKHHQQFC
jgi:hypothetical protein